MLSTIVLAGVHIYAAKPTNRRGKGEFDKLRFVFASETSVNIGIKLNKPYMLKGKKLFFSKMFIMSVSDIRQRLNGAAGMMNAHLITDCMPVKADFAL